MSTHWNPEQYLLFEDERARPFADLLARVPVAAPEMVVDLGCGPGTTTVHLLDRWPEARIVGVDSSAEMIERAKPLEVADRLEFYRGDLREWKAERPVDVLLCCATLQWVPGHVELLPRFVEALAPGGAFAFQVPGNFDQPSHALMRQMATSPRWEGRLTEAVAAGNRSLEPDEYLKALLATGAEVDVWETTYLHVLRGPDAVLEWISGTGLRPVLAELDRGSADDKREFLDGYADALRLAYPPDSAGRTVFPFRRIFGVARKPES